VLSSPCHFAHTKAAHVQKATSRMYRVARDFAVHEAMSGCTTQFDMRHGSTVLAQPVSNYTQ
jgi:hypothetical protein